jgi:SPP1 family holin
MKDVKKVVSVIMLLVGIANSVLSLLGQSPLDITGDTVNAVVTGLVSIVGAVGAVWYNFNFTAEAKVAQSVLDDAKEQAYYARHAR